MASQTGSIDLTASNSVKLAAEAGWQSDLDSYYTKSEIDVTVGGINSTVSTKVGEDEVISSINQSSESVSINANKINLVGAVTIGDLASDAQNATLNSNLEIGGRNLLTGTGDYSTKSTTNQTGITVSSDTFGGTKVLVGTWSSGNMDMGRFANAFSISLRPDSDYTLSFWAKATAAVSVVSYLFTPSTVVSGENSSGNTTTMSDGTIDTTLSTEWERYWVTWHTSTAASQATQVIAARVGKSASGQTVYLAGVKFEQGNKATDWTPAPEDVDGSISDAAKTATNYATDITGGGVMVHPSDDATTGVQITSDVDIMRDGTSVINIGTNDAVRIGVDDNAHVKMLLESDGLGISNEADDTIFAVESSSTGTTTVTVARTAATWTKETDVVATTYTVSDASAVAGNATVTATVAGTDYTLDSTHATATVTAETGVSVVFTPDGVDYVLSLMSDANVTTGKLSVEYQRTAADSAQLAFNGNQIVTGVGRAMRLHNNQWSNNSQTETFYVAKTEFTGAAVMFGVGSGGYNRGVFDATTGTWLIYRNQSAQTVISGSNFAVYANGGIRTRGGGNSDFSGRIVAQQRIESRNSLGNVALEAANSGNKGVWDTTDSLWIICRTSDGNIVINGDNFSVASSGNVSAGTTVTARGENNVALYSSASSGDMGLRDMTNSKWIIYRHHDYGIVLGNSAADTLYHRTSTCTVTSANATIYNNINYCWQNGAACTVYLSVNLKSSLANASAVDVATAPANYRPPHAVMGSVYVTGQNVNLQAEILGDGTIRVNNRSGTTITSSANIYMSFTFAL